MFFLQQTYSSPLLYLEVTIELINLPDVMNSPPMQITAKEI